MRQHNTLFNKVTPPPKHFSKPKQVVTVPISGSSGKGLTNEQYRGILNGIDTLNEATAVQRKEYNSYVEYNEKATVRSDYNIADMTKLAKSLERLIDELQKKQAVQDKWNTYFNQMIKGAKNGAVSESTLEARLKSLQDQIDAIKKQSSVDNTTDSILELTNQLEEKTKQITNIVRVLEQLPGFVVSIDKVCNRTEGGFEIIYKTISFKDIDLNAELPEVDDGIPETDVPDLEDGGDEGEVIPPDGNYEDDDPPPVTDPVKTAGTEVKLVSPEDMKFSKLYANSTKLTDINISLTETKTAIEQIKAAITQLSANNSPLGVIFSAEIQLFSTTRALVVNKACAISDLSFSITVEGYNMSLSVSSATTDFKIYGVSTNLIYTGNSANYNNQHKSGRGWGGLQVIHSRISGSSNKKYSIDMQQFAQGNDNNNSWQNEQWTNTGGITQFHVIAVGTIGTTSSSSSPTVNITPPTVPNTAEFSPSCGDKTEVPIEPEPAPEEKT